MFIGGTTGAFLSLLGLLLDPLVGAGASESIAKRDVLQAGRTSLDTFIGLIIGMIVKTGYASVTVLTLLSVWTFNLPI